MEVDGKKKRGPAPKPPGEKVEQLTIRLTPKLKFGLSLLGRAQRGRSLSQVVEWAIQRGLNAVDVGSEGKTVGQVLDIAWGGSEWQTLRALHRYAPELLDFNERAVIDALEGIVEFSDLREGFTVRADAAIRVKKTAEQKQLVADAEAYAVRVRYSLDKYITLHWEQLKKAIEDMESQGKALKNLRLSKLVPPWARPADWSLETLEHYLAEHSIQPFTQGASKAGHAGV